MLATETTSATNTPTARSIGFQLFILNFAEAKAEMGSLTQDDLNNSINKLQARAGLPAMTTTPDADPANNMGVSNLIWEIRRCRRCELIMDNWYRYWDLIRWHQLDKLDSTKYRTPCWAPT